MATYIVQIQIIDADKLGHESYVPGTDCYLRLVEHFGDAVVDPDSKQINRKALGAIVFENEAQLRALESIVWPAIGTLIERRIAHLRSEHCRFIILEAAILYEAGWQKYVSEVWFIQIDRIIALNRLMARNGLSKEQAEFRLDKQIRKESHCEDASVIIDTSSMSLDEMSEIVILSCRGRI